MKSYRTSDSTKYMLFVFLLWSTIGISIILFIETIALGYDYTHNIKWLVLFTISLSTYIFYRKNIGREAIEHLFFSVLIMVMLPVAWLYSGLNSHFTVAYVFIILIALCYFFEGAKRYTFILVLFIVSLVFLELEVYKPELFTIMPDEQMKKDILVQTPLTFGVATVFLVTYANTLIKKNAVLDRLSKIDDLSGVYNRRYIYGYLEDKWRSSQLSHIQVGILDIDDFKMINDQYGHAVGDLAIQVMANYLTETLGDFGVVGRIGGDEFIVVLESGGEIIESLEAIKDPGQYIEAYLPIESIHFSSGFSDLGAFENIDKCINAADSAMYQSKKMRKTND